MGALCARSDGQEDTTIYKQQVGKDYKELTEQFVGSGCKRTCAWEAEISRKQLERKRDEFWVTRPSGSRHVWSLLKAAVEADAETAKMILQAREIRIENESMTVCYDPHGTRYDIPVYILNDPTKFTTGKLAPSKTKRPAKEQLIKIKVRCFQIGAEDISLELSNTSSVEQLKQMYLDKAEKEMEIGKLRVFFGGKELKDDEDLISNNIRSNTVVQIMLRK